MATEIGDCATVLEQWVHDSANLPAEISYMMEEIQAIDKEMAKHLGTIASREGTLQKQVKNHGSLQAHPKEQEYTEYAKKHYDLCLDLQKKKIDHSDKACLILDRQLRKLDERILQLQRSGQMEDEPPLPSVFTRKGENTKLPLDASQSTTALQAANMNALNISRNSQLNSTPIIRAPQPRQIQAITATIPAQRASAPVTPAATAVIQKQTEREQSAGADSKRRKLNMSITGINLPAQPSGLRQSSMGPGTPKAGTPTGSRAGSIPRVTIPANKKLGITINKKIGNPVVTKLKGKHIKHGRLSQSGRKKAGSPAVRGARGGTEASEDSVLSSADASDTDTSQAKRRKKKQAQPDPPSASEEEEDETDDKVYCYCNQPSYGEMVGCENETCKREWFHIACLGLKTVPSEDHWYCPECRTEVEAQSNKKKK